MHEAPSKRLEVTRHAIDVYLLSQESNGSIRGVEYWQNANGYTAIALHDFWAGSVHYKSAVESALSKIDLSQPNFINEFNDDSMWWALASIAAYYAYGQNDVHLKRARTIHKHVTGSVVKNGEYNIHGIDMEGGVFWTTRADEQNLNAITTGLFAELSGELAALETSTESGNVAFGAQNPFQDVSQSADSVVNSETDRATFATALRSLDWIRRCRLSGSIVKDTIKVHDQEFVDWIFTYNTGQLIGASVAITKSIPSWHPRQNELLHLACSLAEAAMKFPDWHEPDGTLTEAGAYGPRNHQAYENNDAVGFKSILVRNLAKLYQELTRLASIGHSKALDATRLHLRDYFILQYDSLQSKNVNEISQYGPWWAGPFDLPTSHAQMAVLDVMAAVHLVETESF